MSCAISGFFVGALADEMVGLKDGQMKCGDTSADMLTDWQMLQV